MPDVKRPGPPSRGGKKRSRKPDREVPGARSGGDYPTDNDRDRDPRAESSGTDDPEDREMTDGPSSDVHEEDRDREPTFSHPEEDAHPDESDPDREERPERNEPQSRLPPPAHRGGPPPRMRPSDEFAFQIYYDRNARNFSGSVLEYPEIRATGIDRQEVSDELEIKLEQHLKNSKDRGTEPYFSRRYPEKLEVRISAGLFRRLDLCSRQEKVPLDQLVSEMLSGALEKRFESGHRAGQQHQQHHQQDRRPHHNNQQGGGGQRRGGGQGQGQGQGRAPRGKAYQDTMNNRENFMEYVRNLEKNGGNPGGGGWRKK